MICESAQDHLVISRPANGRDIDEDKHRSGKSIGEPLPQVPGPLAQGQRPQDTAPGRRRKRSLRHLHVTIPRTGEQARDSERLGRVHGLLQSYEGDDRFSLYLVSDGRQVQLNFPNATTAHCPALEEELIEMLGSEALRVD